MKAGEGREGRGSATKERIDFGFYAGMSLRGEAEGVAGSFPDHTRLKTLKRNKHTQIL